MQTNGTISPAIITETVNEYGEVSATDKEWGDAVPCLIQTNTDNRIGKYEDGEFRVSSHTVVIECDASLFENESQETDDLGILATATALGRVKMEKHGYTLGEYRIQSCDLFPRMGRIVLHVVQL